MFSLVEFHNNSWSVVGSKNVQNFTNKMCAVKVNGGKYSALLLTKSGKKYFTNEHN